MRFDASPSRNSLAPLQVNASEIENWLLAREPTATGGWRDMGADEYSRAFTAAQTAGTDIADDLYYGIVDTISRGGTEEDFSKLVMPILRKKGWLGDEGKRAMRVALIYDTNLRLARAAGRWDRIQATKSAFPYLRGATADDSRVRHPPKSPHSDHRAWEGIILPVDHSFWQRWWTPLGFRCRCYVIPMSRSQLARYHGGVTSEAELGAREARLGQPIFRSPAAGIAPQLADMAARTNAERMPGMPAVNPLDTREQGSALWDIAFSERALAALDEMLAKLFGTAA